MKKIKLLMPIAGLSAITAAAIPLTSCNKNKVVDGVQVTEQEWNDAFTYLAACKEGASWKTTSEDSFQISHFKDGAFTEFCEYHDIAFNDDLGSMKATGYTKGSKEIETDELASILRSNLYFTYVKDEETTWDCQLEKISMISEFLVEFVKEVGGIKDYKFNDNDKAYQFIGEVTIKGKKGYSNSTIRFNGNKKISYMNIHTAVFEDDGNPYGIFNAVLHPNYSNVTVNVPTELINRANSHTLTVVNNKATLPSDNKLDPVILNLTNNAQINTIEIKNQNNVTITTIEDQGIYVNDTLLADDDYTLTSGKITFKTPIPANSKVALGLHSWASSDTELRLTIA